MTEKSTAVEQGTREFVTSSGYRVTFKKSLGWREMWEFTRKLTGITGMPDVDTAAKQVSILVESWDLPGDPGNPKTWDEDMFFEFAEIFAATGRYYQRRVVMMGNLSETLPEEST